MNKFVEEEREPGAYLSTGSLLLDLAISHKKTPYGGIPTRRIIELSGEGGAGKTYISTAICRSAKEQGFKIYIDDVERRWDMDRLDHFGLSEDDFDDYYSSNTVEECFERLFKHMDKNKGTEKKPGPKQLYIVDPIAALQAQQEITGSDKMSQARAKALQKGFRKLKSRLGNGSDEILVVLANQVIDNVGVMFGPKKTTPGGNSMKHWPSIRIQFVNPAKLKAAASGPKSKQVIGIRTLFNIVKNSEDDPFRSAKYSILWGLGVDNISDCVRWLHGYSDALTPNKKTLLVYGDFEVACGKDAKDNGIKKFVRHVEKSCLEKEIFDLTVSEFTKFYKPAKRKKPVGW